VHRYRNFHQGKGGEGSKGTFNATSKRDGEAGCDANAKKKKTAKHARKRGGDTKYPEREERFFRLYHISLRFCPKAPFKTKPLCRRCEEGFSRKEEEKSSSAKRDDTRGTPHEKKTPINFVHEKQIKMCIQEEERFRSEKEKVKRTALLLLKTKLEIPRPLHPHVGGRRRKRTWGRIHKWGSLMILELASYRDKTKKNKETGVRKNVAGSVNRNRVSVRGVKKEGKEGLSGKR